MSNPQTTPEPDYEATLAVPNQIDLRYLNQPSHHRFPSPAEQASPTGLRIAARSQGRAHQIELIWKHPATSVQVRIWGPCPESLAPRLPDLLGFSDTSARDFRPRHEPVQGWLRKSPGLRLSENLSVFDTLIPILLAQRILGKEAKHIHRRMFRLAGENPPGPPGLRVPPSPSNLRQIGYETWHQIGLERKRARLIHDCAKMAARIESWRNLDTETFYTNLVGVPGIGPWTANRLLYALGHADAVWIGDYNLPSMVSWNLCGEPRATDARMLELLEPYRGHRARVLRPMEIHGTAPPRFGPRLPLRNIQQH